MSSSEVQTALKQLRVLEASPEVLTPWRHGFLYIQSGGMLSFGKILSVKWFMLDDTCFAWSESPQATGGARPVLSAPLASVGLSKAAAQHQGKPMYGFVVTAINGDTKTLFAEDVNVRDRWIRALEAVIMLAAGRPLMLADWYKLSYDNLLGTGLFAMVVSGTELIKNEPVAVKVIKPDAFKTYRDLMEREACIWSAVGHHPNIVGVTAVLHSKNSMYFISELCSGGGLVDCIARTPNYSERDASRLFNQMLQAVSHIHSKGIVHMDLKPENIVMKTKAMDSPLKLLDFGLASFFDQPTEPGGTPEFVAPEILTDPDHYAMEGCGPSVDMWAMGIILYYLLSGQTPFNAPTMDQIVDKVKAAQWGFKGKRWASVSSSARDLISRLLQVEPRKRLTVNQALDHKWVKYPAYNSTAALPDAIDTFKSHAKLSINKSSWIRRSGTLSDWSFNNVSPGSVGQAGSAGGDASSAIPLSQGGVLGVIGGIGQGGLNSPASAQSLDPRYRRPSMPAQYPMIVQEQYQQLLDQVAFAQAKVRRPSELSEGMGRMGQWGSTQYIGPILETLQEASMPRSSPITQQLSHQSSLLSQGLSPHPSQHNKGLASHQGQLASDPSQHSQGLAFHPSQLASHPSQLSQGLASHPSQLASHPCQLASHPSQLASHPSQITSHSDQHIQGLASHPSQHTQGLSQVLSSHVSGHTPLLGLGEQAPVIHGLANIQAQAQAQAQLKSNSQRVLPATAEIPRQQLFPSSSMGRHQQFPTLSHQPMSYLNSSSNLGGTSSTGQLGTVPTTGQLGTVPSTGQLRTVPSTDQPGTVPSTGQLGAVPSTGQLGTVASTGQLGTLANSEQLDSCSSQEHSSSFLEVGTGDIIEDRKSPLNLQDLRAQLLMLKVAKARRESASIPDLQSLATKAPTRGVTAPNLPNISISPSTSSGPLHSVDIYTSTHSSPAGSYFVQASDVSSIPTMPQAQTQPRLQTPPLTHPQLPIPTNAPSLRQASSPGVPQHNSADLSAQAAELALKQQRLQQLQAQLATQQVLIQQQQSMLATQQQQMNRQQQQMQIQMKEQKQQQQQQQLQQPQR